MDSPPTLRLRSPHSSDRGGHNYDLSKTGERETSSTRRESSKERHYRKQRSRHDDYRESSKERHYHDRKRRRHGHDDRREPSQERHYRDCNRIRHDHREKSEERHYRDDKEHTGRENVDKISKKKVPEEQDKKHKKGSSSPGFRTKNIDENELTYGRQRYYRLLTVYSCDEQKLIDNKLRSRCKKIFASHDHDIKEGKVDPVHQALPIAGLSFGEGDAHRVSCDPEAVPGKYMIYRFMAESVVSWYNCGRLRWSQFVLDKVLRVDLDFVSCFVYYLTFTVIDLEAGEDAPRKTFHALVKELYPSHDALDLLYLKIMPDELEFTVPSMYGVVV